jgi:SOS response regulatory protein OraA/RecX
LSGYSDKVKIQITESEEIGNIISAIMNKKGIKTTDMLKEQVSIALKERGYNDEIISMWLEHLE